MHDKVSLHCKVSTQACNRSSPVVTMQLKTISINLHELDLSKKMNVIKYSLKIHFKQPRCLKTSKLKELTWCAVE